MRGVMALWVLLITIFMSSFVSASNCKNVSGRLIGFDSKVVMLENWDSKGTTVLAIAKLPKQDINFFKSNTGKIVDICIPHEAFLYKK